MDISETIKEIRRACLLSQLEFSKEIGVSFSTVNRWENNRAVPNYQALKKIKEFCDKKGILFDLDKKIWEEENECNQSVQRLRRLGSRL